MQDSRPTWLQQPAYFESGLAIYRACHTHQPSARVLFCHGNGLSAACNAHFLDELARFADVYAYDARGHGASAPFASPDQVNGWRPFVDDILFLARSKALASFNPSLPLHFVGHSLSANSALASLSRSPNTFDGVHLVEPVLLPAGLTLSYHLSRLMGLGLYTHPLAHATLKRRTSWPRRQAAFDYLFGRKALATWPAEAVSNYVFSALRPETDGQGSEQVTLCCPPAIESRIFVDIPSTYITAKLHQHAPVHVIRGTGKGSTVDARRLQALDSRLSDLHVSAVSNVGHFAMIEKPDECAALIRAKIGANGS